VFLVEEGSDVTGEDLIHHGTPFHPQALMSTVPKKMDLVFDDWIVIWINWAEWNNPNYA
jgi:hypothetical protein